jgi:tRNA1(Val) A37 N6-methylase TrmN6
LFLYQDENGFLFNSDSHFLYDFISKLNPKADILDIGCGCGILGLLVARDFKINLYQIDKQKECITLTKQNAKINNIKTNTIEADFLEHKFDRSFDFIISNPPYYHDGVFKSENSAINISRYSYHMPLEKFIQKSSKIIKDKGHFIFCYDAKQIQNILSILKENRLTVVDMRFVHGKNTKPSSLVMIHARKGSNSLSTIHPPLFAFDLKENSDEVKNIYKKTRTYSIKCTI